MIQYSDWHLVFKTLLWVNSTQPVEISSPKPLPTAKNSYLATMFAVRESQDIISWNIIISFSQFSIYKTSSYLATMFAVRESLEENCFSAWPLCSTCHWSSWLGSSLQTPLHSFGNNTHHLFLPSGRLLSQHCVRELLQRGRDVCHVLTNTFCQLG